MLPLSTAKGLEKDFHAWKRQFWLTMEGRVTNGTHTPSVKPTKSRPTMAIPGESNKKRRVIKPSIELSSKESKSCCKSSAGEDSSRSCECKETETGSSAAAEVGV